MRWLGVRFGAILDMRFAVVIPVYNVAPYLRACLDSLLAQAFADWEAICVDDGSTDGSGAILDEYAAKDGRFRVLHQANAGVAAARNAGLDAACGDWVVFADSDDVMRSRFFEESVEMIAMNPRADVVAMSTMRFDGGRVPEWPPEKLVQRHVVDISARLTEEVFELQVVSGAYRRESIGDLRFPPLSIGEDRVFVVSFLERAKQVVLSDYVGYGYRQRMGSAYHTRWTAEKFQSRLRHHLLIARVIEGSCKRYETRLRREFGRDITESMACDYARLPHADRLKVWKDWTEAFRKVSRASWTTCGIRLTTGLVGATQSHVLMWLLCSFVGWLRYHGLNRRLRVVRRTDLL